MELSLLLPKTVIFNLNNAKTCVHLNNGGGWGQSANNKTDSLERKIKMQQIVCVNKNVVLKKKKKTFLIGMFRIYLKDQYPGQLSISIFFN